MQWLGGTTHIYGSANLLVDISQMKVRKIREDIYVTQLTFFRFLLKVCELCLTLDVQLRFSKSEAKRFLMSEIKRIEKSESRSVKSELKDVIREKSKDL